MGSKPFQPDWANYHQGHADGLGEAAELCEDEAKRLQSNRHYGFQVAQDLAALLRALQTKAAAVQSKAAAAVSERGTPCAYRVELPHSLPAYTEADHEAEWYQRQYPSAKITPLYERNGWEDDPNKQPHGDDRDRT